MSNFINTYGGDLNAMASGVEAVKRAQLAGMSIGQIQNMARSEGVSFGARAQDYFGYQNRIADLQKTFEQQMQQMQQQNQQQVQQQSQQFATAQRRLQQQSLESQTRQAAPQRSAQVLGPGNSLIIRPGTANKFSRPKLQIKSMNI